MNDLFIVVGEGYCFFFWLQNLLVVVVGDVLGCYDVEVSVGSQLVCFGVEECVVDVDVIGVQKDFDIVLRVDVNYGKSCVLWE